MNKIIEDWDNIYCEQHISNSISILEEILPLYYHNNDICLIDIGANVGKVYDLLTKNFHISETYMFEANTRLYEYLVNKYRDTRNIYIYNNAVYIENSLVYFDESSMDYQMRHKCIEDINLGLSHITTDTTQKLTEAITLSDFLEKNNHIFFKNCLIKIDTENYDYQILSNLAEVVHKFQNKPIIEFENNYFHLGEDLIWAQNIVDRYANAGYEKLVIERDIGDFILKPSL